MPENITADILEKWLTGWSLSRGLPLPVKFKSGFKVDVGSDRQKTRYVFLAPNKDFTELANSISEPWIYLKVCAPPYAIKDLLAPGWVIQPQGYMMSCLKQIIDKPIALPDEYKMMVEEQDSVYIIKIMTSRNDLAAIGRLVLVDGLAIYDRISTEVNHQRKGLATILMATLEKIALSKGTYTNFLVATQEGKLLYESIGWQLSSLYTSAVIPGK